MANQCTKKRKLAPIRRRCSPQFPNLALIGALVVSGSITGHAVDPALGSNHLRHQHPQHFTKERESNGGGRITTGDPINRSAVTLKNSDSTRRLQNYEYIKEDYKVHDGTGSQKGDEKTSTSSSTGVDISLGISSAGKGKKSSKSSKKGGKSKRSGKSSKSGKHGKQDKTTKGSSKGKGKPDGGNNHGDDDKWNSDDDDDDNGNGNGGTKPTPTTPSPIPPPGGGGKPTPDRPSQPTPPPTQAHRPTPAPTEAKCLISEDGFFGSGQGLTSELQFFYQIQVVPSVSSVRDINNSDILNNIEREIGQRTIARLFEQCFPDSWQSNQIGSSQAGRRNRPGARLLRILQDVEQLNGIDTRPVDEVLEGVDCVNVEQVFRCFVVRGVITAYTDESITSTEVEAIQRALRGAIESGEIDGADSRVVDVSWRDIDSYPIPGFGTSESPTAAPTVEDGGVTTSPTIEDGDATAVPTIENGGGESPTNGSSVITGTRGINDLDTWAIALIATGAALFLCMGYLCLRRGKRDPIYDDDDDDDDIVSKRSNDSGDEEAKKNEATPLVTPEYEPPRPAGALSPKAATSVRPPVPEQRQRAEPYRDPYNISPQKSRLPQYGQVQGAKDSSQTEKESQSLGSDEDREKAFTGQSFGQNSNDPSGPSFGTADDNEMTSPFGSKRSSEWDEGMFQSANPPMESTSEEEEEVSSAEYSDEGEDVEYEIEYYEDEEGLDDGVDEIEYDEDEDEEDSYDDDYDQEEIIVDAPGATPILPWLAQDDQ